MGKGTGILWGEEYAPQRYAPARKRMDNKKDGSYHKWPLTDL